MIHQALPRGTARYAVALSVLAGLLFALTQALAVGPLSSADESAHVDYAYQVWHGDLPVFEDGLVLDPPKGYLPPVQWTAQHPPLYYVLLAPVVGPLLDAGRPVLATYAGRAVSMALLAAFVVAAWWAARQATRPGSPLPEAVALVVACSAWTARLGGSAYNDLLAAALLTVLLGLTARSMRRGLSTRLVVGISLVAAATALARASALVLAVVVVGVAIGSALLSRPRAMRHAVALTVAAPVAVLLAGGWFYLRNLRLTGNLTGGHPDWAAEHLNRTTRSLGEAATDLGTWAALLDVFRWGGFLPPGAGAVYLLVVPGVIGGAWFAARWWMRGPARESGERRVPVAVLLVGVTAAAIAMQIAYTTSNGAANPRYLLPVLLPLALAVAAFMAVRPEVVVGAWVLVVVADFGFWLAGRLDLPPGAGYPPLTDAALVAAGAAGAVAFLAAALVVLTFRRAPVAD